MQELQAFFAVMPYQLSLQTCNPTDLLVFMEQWYVPRHTGSLVRGRPMAAPSSIATVVSICTRSSRSWGVGNSEITARRQATQPAAQSYISETRATRKSMSQLAGRAQVQWS